MSYSPVIGLEIHVELKTKSKMFCSCLNDSNEKTANVNVCPICLGHPGTLPVINKEAVRKVVKTGLALNCQISEHSMFDRKNYFYPDLPKGYQISQYDLPLCKNGFLEIEGKRIRINRIHLEEDVGRLIHEKDNSLVDFNRAGIPLMELVTEPDIKGAVEARKFAEEFQLILRYLGVSDADMEKGQMRVEANISVSLEKSKALGTKVEVKNLNSFRAVEKAIDCEIERQINILKSKKKVVQETRGWSEKELKTISQRTKEEAHDYRYFPEPDLPPLRLDSQFIDNIKKELPEFPFNKRIRFKNEYQIDQNQIENFVSNKDLGEYFEKVVSELRNWLKNDRTEEKIEEQDYLKLVKVAANYILTDLQGLLKGMSVESENFLITPENFAEFIILIHEGTISSKIAKLILKEMFLKGKDPSHIMEEEGLSLITNELELEKIIKSVLKQNSKPAADYRKGKETALQFLIGRVMAQTRGKADPGKVSKILKEIL